MVLMTHDVVDDNDDDAGALLSLSCLLSIWVTS